MDTNTAKIKIPKPTADQLKARRAALQRIRGMWRGRYKGILKENRKLRKEWDKRVNKLHW